MLQQEPWLPQVHQSDLCSLGHLLAWKPSQIQAWVLIFKAFDGTDPAWLKDQLWHKDGNRDCQQLHHSQQWTHPAWGPCLPVAETGSSLRTNSSQLVKKEQCLGYWAIPLFCISHLSAKTWIRATLGLVCFCFFFLFYFILSKIVISVSWTHVKSLVLGLFPSNEVPCWQDKIHYS